VHADKSWILGSHRPRERMTIVCNLLLDGGGTVINLLWSNPAQQALQPHTLTGQPQERSGHAGRCTALVQVQRPTGDGAADPSGRGESSSSRRPLPPPGLQLLLPLTAAATSIPRATWVLRLWFAFFNLPRSWHLSPSFPLSLGLVDRIDSFIGCSCLLSLNWRVRGAGAVDSPP
jgi:hypothetical protein